MKILSKISLAGVSGKVKGSKERLQKLLNDGSIQLCQIYGIANSMAAKESDIGPYVKFGGSFKAINLETGEMFRSGTCILPAIAEGLLSGAFSDSVKSVQFAFKFSARYDETSVASFVYEVESLLDAGDNDPLSQLEQTDLRGKLALPAPTVTNQTQQITHNETNYAMADVMPEEPEFAEVGHEDTKKSRRRA